MSSLIWEIGERWYKRPEKETLTTRGAFSTLKRIWCSKNTSRRTNLKLYKTPVAPVLLYGCETWKTNKGWWWQGRRWKNTCMVQWQDRVSTEELPKRADRGRSEDERWSDIYMIVLWTKTGPTNLQWHRHQKEKEEEEDQRPPGGTQLKKEERK